MLYLDFVLRTAQLDDAARHVRTFAQKQIGLMKKTAISFVKNGILLKQFTHINPIKPHYMFRAQLAYSTQIRPTYMTKVR